MQDAYQFPDIQVRRDSQCIAKEIVIMFPTGKPVVIESPEAEKIQHTALMSGYTLVEWIYLQLNRHQN